LERELLIADEFISFDGNPPTDGYTQKVAIIKTTPGTPPDSIHLSDSPENYDSSDRYGVYLRTNPSESISSVGSFLIRDTAGSTSDNPLLPTSTSTDGYQFTIEVVDGQEIFIDPIVSIGYDYIVNSGPNVQTVTLPLGIDENDSYDLWLFNGTEFVDSGTDILAGVTYDFGIGGVDQFRIMGIETSVELDPTDSNAFVTGLTFAGSGQVDISQNPVTFDTDAITNANNVPEPTTLFLLGLGFIGLIGMRKKSANNAYSLSA